MSIIDALVVGMLIFIAGYIIGRIRTENILGKSYNQQLEVNRNRYLSDLDRIKKEHERFCDEQIKKAENERDRIINAIYARLKERGIIIDNNDS